MVQLTTSDAVQQAITETIEPGMLLSVGWCTHKYKHTEDGERQQAKGSGKRTHFYLLACREHAETSAGQELQPSLCLGHAYHTTMWFEGTCCLWCCKPGKPKKRRESIEYYGRRETKPPKNQSLSLFQLYKNGRRPVGRAFYISRRGMREDVAKTKDVAKKSPCTGHKASKDWMLVHTHVHTHTHIDSVDEAELNGVAIVFFSKRSKNRGQKYEGMAKVVASWKFPQVWMSLCQTFTKRLRPWDIKKAIEISWLFNRDSYKWLLKNPHLTGYFFDFIPNIPKTTTLAILRVMCPYLRWLIKWPQIKGLFLWPSTPRFGKNNGKTAGESSPGNEDLGYIDLLVVLFCFFGKVPNVEQKSHQMASYGLLPVLLAEGQTSC